VSNDKEAGQQTLKPPHKNRLAQESSTYLKQHAENPVDWYPWGEEALQKAVNENRPILLSVGYSACHWCHVMAHESFEDEETAARAYMEFIRTQELRQVEKICLGKENVFLF